MNLSTSSIVELSAIIEKNAALVSKYLDAQGLPQPTFDIDSPDKLPNIQEIQDARLSLLSAARALEDVVLGPEDLLKSIQPNEVVALQAIYRYRIAQAFPVGETIGYEELSARVGLNAVDLRRLLRLAMTRHVFREPAAGLVAHTAASRLLATDDRAYEWAGIVTEERFPAAARTVDALQRYGQARSVDQCGFALANDTDKGLYDHLAAHSARRDRWSKAMSAIAKEVDFAFLLSSFDWFALPPGATVVDVGGGRGDVSIGLARRLADAGREDVRFVVQDRAETVVGLADAAAAAATSSSTAAVVADGRVSFEAHDFFTPQPRRDAAVYYFRNVFHNWPDAQCVEILRRHVPAMAAATRLIIDDYALHDPLTVDDFAERQSRAMDVTMLVYFGSRERTVAEWADLLREADPRFVIRRTSRHPKQMSTIFEVGWDA